MLSKLRGALRFLRDRWHAASEMDRRLDGAKHDPTLTKEADYEKLKENGRILPPGLF